MADRRRNLFSPDLQIVSHHTVAPYEVNLIAQAEQKRIAAAEPVAELLAGLRSNLNRLDHEIASEARELNTARERVEEHDQRKYAPEFSSRTYWLVMFLLVTIEIPINAAALDFARLAIWETYVVAAGFGLLNFLGSKSVARVLRQKSWNDRAWRDWFVALTVVGSLAFALVEFAALRRMDPVRGGSAFAFLALQITFFVATAAVSYFHFDPDHEREQLHRRIMLGRKRMHGLWQQRASLAKQYNARRASAELTLDAIIHDFHERAAQYRDANLLMRTDEAPGFMTHAVPYGVFRPIDLGAPIDEEPKAIGEITESTWKEETDK